MENPNAKQLVAQIFGIAQSMGFDLNAAIKGNCPICKDKDMKGVVCPFCDGTGKLTGEQENTVSNT